MFRLIFTLTLCLLLAAFCLGQDTPAIPSQTIQSDITKGVVRVKATLLASGEVGDVSIVSGLTDDLNQRAIAAAKKIKFEPKKVDGQPLTTVATFEYTFEIVSDETDKSIAKPAVISTMPKAKHPSSKALSSVGGEVILVVLLAGDGTTHVWAAESSLPPEFEQRAREASKKIKFEPAKGNNGKNISVTRKITYEFVPQK